MSSKQSNSGFTLTEIVVVLIIVGVTATLALPRFTATIERMRAAEGVQILTALLGGQKVYEFENGGYANNPNLIDVEITQSENFDLGQTSLRNPGNPVTSYIARIQRINAYRLEINEEGSIRCVNAGASFTCAQAGIGGAF